MRKTRRRDWKLQSTTEKQNASWVKPYTVYSGFHPSKHHGSCSCWELNSSGSFFFFFLHQTSNSKVKNELYCSHLDFYHVLLWLLILTNIKSKKKIKLSLFIFNRHMCCCSTEQPPGGAAGALQGFNLWNNECVMQLKMLMLINMIDHVSVQKSLRTISF